VNEMPDLRTILVRLPHADKDRVKEAVERIYGGHALAWAAEPRGITAYPIDDEPVVITFEIPRN